MKKLTGIILACILTGMVSAAGEFSETIKRGNEHYQKGEYEKAVALYQSIVDSGYTSAELYYNLGNAYYKTHDITMALVNYERAHILDPKDEEIQHNLDVAREFVVDRIDVLPEFFLSRAFHVFVKTFDADAWAYQSLASFLLFLLLLGVYFFSKRIAIRRLGFWFAVLLLVISVSTILFAAEQNRLVTRHHQALILAPSVTIISSPDETSGTDLFLLHEGTKVRVDDELGQWREVVLSDGNRGWLKASELIML